MFSLGVPTRGVLFGYSCVNGLNLQTLNESLIDKRGKLYERVFLLGTNHICIVLKL